LAWNNKIFEDTPPSVNAVVYKTLGLHQLWRDIHPYKGKKKLLKNPHIVDDHPKGWFDGAAQGNGLLAS
jgi:hypothetical protein